MMELLVIVKPETVIHWHQELIIQVKPYDLTQSESSIFKYKFH
jgi:hypothetical protein